MQTAMRRCALTTLSAACSLATASAAAATLSLSLNGLDDLGPNAAYEGWVIVNGAPVSTGTFTVDSSGVPSRTTFDVDDADAATASAFVLTIEPVPDANPAPSNTHLLGGDFANGSANLSIAHSAALGNDFTGASGNFILAAPSGDPAMTAFSQGIWWVDPSGPTPGLNLPTLPAGWAYEGWVAEGGVPTSTGRFTSVSGADSDGPGPAAGPNPGPPFPGQDFVNPPRDLIGVNAVITIEPEPDNAATPFTLKPLFATVADSMALQAMTNQAAATSPTGTAVLRGSVVGQPAIAAPVNSKLALLSMLALLIGATWLWMRRSSSGR